ncbi:copper transporter 1 [Lactuca sativa]|uniref:copper transporter 1 n=1 Tax=Lactuca sativa TaxID=4236 RepID=UPI000CAC50E9|nr:copper transporter 1 [Lactuca sativa]
MAPPPMMTNGVNGTTLGMPRRKRMIMHMTFYWGKDALILFKGWPGPNNIGMYALALIFVFFMALLVEWLADAMSRMKSEGAASGLAQTMLYGLRVGIGNMVMLALMSFNVGVFLVAVLGHTLGFFFFRVIIRSREERDVISNSC